MIRNHDEQMMATRRLRSLLLVICGTLAALLACSPSHERATMPGRIPVVASTTIVGDIVSAVGGGAIELHTLLPRETDPHSFEPIPMDLKILASARIVFINGAGLERFLEPLLQTSMQGGHVISLSEGLELRHLQSADPVHDDKNDGSDGHRSSFSRDVDPHVWFDPTMVMVWTGTIARALAKVDPPHAGFFAANAESLVAELERLDEWIVSTVSLLPERRRVLVTDHAAFGYFADRYGFKQVGAVFPGFSTLAEPSARDLAQLERAIHAQGVPAVFVGISTNQELAKRIAEDTGIRIIPLYIGSLSESDGPAPDYQSLMRYVVTAMIDALSSGPVVH